MGKVTAQQEAAMNVLDWLLFNRLTVAGGIDQVAIRGWRDLIDQVDKAVASKGVDGVGADVIKHYILCFLEILLSDYASLEPDMIRLQEFHQRFFISMCIVHNINLSEPECYVALELAEELLPAYRNAPPAMRYRLAERCLVTKYPDAPVQFLIWCVRAGVMPCSRYKDGTPLPKSYETVISRIGLLCEFELARVAVRGMQKRRLPVVDLFDRLTANMDRHDAAIVREAGTLYLDQHFGPEAPRPKLIRFDIARAFDDHYATFFLRQMGRLWQRPRLQHSTAAGWIGLLGGGEMLTRPETFDMPLYNAKNSAGTRSGSASTAMYTAGFVLDARSIYRHYLNLITHTLHPVRMYSTLLNQSTHVLSADCEDYMYAAVCAHIQSNHTT